MNEAIWRGHRVKVLVASTKRTVILTPLSVRLIVRNAELAELNGRKQRPMRDSHKF